MAALSGVSPHSQPPTLFNISPHSQTMPLFAVSPQPLRPSPSQHFHSPQPHGLPELTKYPIPLLVSERFPCGAGFPTCESPSKPFPPAHPHRLSPHHTPLHIFHSPQDIALPVFTEFPIPQNLFQPVTFPCVPNSVKVPVLSGPRPSRSTAHPKFQPFTYTQVRNHIPLKYRALHIFHSP